MSHKCSKILPSGRPCKNWAIEGSDPPRCQHHGGTPEPHPRSQMCGATTKYGEPCQAWAVLGSDPPRCASHAGLARVLEGRDNPNWKHGFYEKGDLPASLEGLIDTIFRRLDEADKIFDCHMDSRELLELLTLYCKNASVVGKLLRDRQALDRDKDDLLSALGPAIELLEAELENE